MSRQLRPGQLRTGSLYDITSSFALTASYASNANFNTGSFAITGSNVFKGSQTINSYLFISSSETSIPPLWISASNLADGVGAFRADSTEPDIFLNDTDGGYSTVTFANRGESKVAFGRDANDNFYITRATESVWWDDTFVISTNTGVLSLGHGLTVNGYQTNLDSDSYLDNIFIVKNFNDQPVLTVSQSGVITVATHSVNLTSPAPNGGMYFTATSFWVGLD